MSSEDIVYYGEKALMATPLGPAIAGLNLGIKVFNGIFYLILFIMSFTMYFSQRKIKSTHTLLSLLSLILFLALVFSPLISKYANRSGFTKDQIYIYYIGLLFTAMLVMILSRTSDNEEKKINGNTQASGDAKRSSTGIFVVLLIYLLVVGFFSYNPLYPGIYKWYAKEKLL